MKTCLALVQGDAVNVCQHVFCRLDPSSPWCMYWLATVLDATAALDVGVQFERGVLNLEHVIKNMLCV